VSVADIFPRLVRALHYGPLAALCVITLAPQAARANGRFPRAQRLIEHPSDPDKLLVTATYGLITTRDRGQNWYHTCESSYAFVAGEELDAMVDMASDGAIVASAFRTLNRSDESGCHFAPALGSQANHSVPDFSLERGDRNRGIAVLTTAQASGNENQLFETTDGGAHWTELGVPLPADRVRIVLSLDSAPTNSNRIYVTGTDSQGRSQLLRSDDRGENWAVFDIATDASLGEFAYIGAVDPTNADVLYIRTDVWAPNDDGVDEGRDRLLYSNNAGETWQDVFYVAAKMFGLALSPDGSTLLLGYGDPADSRSVDPDALGIYKSSTTGGSFAFGKIFDGSTTCLSWTATGVYVCVSQQDKGFEVGFAASADFTLATANPLTQLMRLTDVRGSLECPDCTTGAACGSEWLSICDVFSACTDAGATGGGGSSSECPDGGLPMDGGGATSGAAGASSAGGVGGVGGSDNGTPDADGSADSGCGCRAPRSKGSLTWSWLAAAAAAGGWLCARRRFRRRS
jgi:hypothetical protein